jgi:phosphate transport system substrate-binding protein
MMKGSILLLAATLLFSACGTDFKKPYSDTTTSGNVTLASDETLQPFTDAEKDTFMGLYRYANITMKHQSEAACFSDLVKDSVKVILATRKLNAQEEAYFKSRNLFPVTTKVAIDALALVVNKDNPDSLIKMSQLMDILSGKTSTWKQFNPSSTLGDITFVFDNNGSSNVRYLRDSVMKGQALPEYCFAAKSNPDVIRYVESHKNAIGVIGVAWISDFKDPAANQFLSRIKVLDVATSANPVYPDDYYKPYQAYIALQQYPLVREVYMINREGRAGLGTGFVSFVAGDQGQRIVRMSGLLPATMPVRLIQTN